MVKTVSMHHINHQSGYFESFPQPTLSTSRSVFSSIFDPFCSLHQLSGGSERNGNKSTLIFCRGCTVWVTRITHGVWGGDERLWRRMRDKKKRRSSGVEEGNVKPTVYPGCDSFILWCIFCLRETLIGDEGPPLSPVTAEMNGDGSKTLRRVY